MMYKEKAFYHKEGSSWYENVDDEKLKEVIKQRAAILDALYEKLYDETIFENPVH